MTKNYTTFKYEADASGLEIDFYLKSVLSVHPVVVNVGSEHSTYLSALADKRVHIYELSDAQYSWLISHAGLAIEALEFRIKNDHSGLSEGLIGEKDQIARMLST